MTDPRSELCDRIRDYFDRMTRTAVRTDGHGQLTLGEERRIVDGFRDVVISAGGSFPEDETIHAELDSRGVCTLFARREGVRVEATIFAPFPRFEP